MTDVSEAEVKRFLLAQASLIASGLIINETGMGNRITDKGMKVAGEKWQKLSDEDKLLFGLMNFRLIRNIQKRREGND